jgi:hypothetical protein
MSRAPFNGIINNTATKPVPVEEQNPAYNQYQVTELLNKTDLSSGINSAYGTSASAIPFAGQKYHSTQFGISAKRNSGSGDVSVRVKFYVCYSDTTKLYPLKGSDGNQLTITMTVTDQTEVREALVVPVTGCLLWL